MVSGVFYVIYDLVKFFLFVCIVFFNEFIDRYIVDICVVLDRKFCIIVFFDNMCVYVLRCCVKVFV